MVNVETTVLQGQGLTSQVFGKISPEARLIVAEPTDVLEFGFLLRIINALDFPNSPVLP